MADALEYGVRAKPVSELPNALYRGVASFADDVGSPKRAGQGDAVRVPAEHDDLLGAESPRGGDSLQAGHTCAQHERFRRCDVARGGRQHRHELRHVLGAHEHRLVADDRCLRRQDDRQGERS
jgi:hypothetical protein